MIDLHSHLAYGFDDGAVDREVCCRMLEAYAAGGVTTVCATSHFYPQDILPEVFLEEREDSLKLLLKGYGHGRRPSILLGAEVLICQGLENMEGLRDLCVQGTDVMLLEMPFTHGDWDRSLYNTVREIKKQGINPVLAHVDRYPKESIEELFDMGLYGQINCDSLVKLFKPKHLLRWIEDGKIVAFGSDLHGNNPKSYAPFTKVMSTMTDHVDHIMRTTATLLKNAKRY